jgi:hypothetical protein
MAAGAKVFKSTVVGMEGNQRVGGGQNPQNWPVNCFYQNLYL